MSTLRHIKGVASIILYTVSFALTVFGYLFAVYEYQGKGNNVPDIVSMDAVIAILVFMVFSIFFASIAFWLGRKNKAVLCAFIVLIVLDLYKITQIILLLHKVGKGILQSI